MMTLLIVLGTAAWIGAIAWAIDEDGDDGGSGDPAGEEVMGTEGPDLLEGTGNADTITGAAGDDTIQGGGGDDAIDGGDGSDSIQGGTGDDEILAGDREDTVRGGTGNDFINGQDGSDTLVGGDGDDELRGGTGADRLLGGANEDTLSGGNGLDTLFGNQGDDSLDGGTGADLLQGGEGNDTIMGLADSIDNGPMGPLDDLDPDTIRGGAGDDELWLGSGDTASGADGADTFIVGPWAWEFQSPWIEDYNGAEDQLAILVPAGSTGDVSITEDPDNAGVALVSYDSEVVARVVGGYPSLAPGDIQILETDDFPVS